MKKTIYTIMIFIMMLLTLGIAGGVETDRISFRVGFILTIICVVVGVINVLLLRLEYRRDNNRIGGRN